MAAAKRQKKKSEKPNILVSNVSFDLRKAHTKTFFFSITKTLNFNLIFRVANVKLVFQ